MTVRQALIQDDLLRETGKWAKVFDDRDNEVGLNGALEEGGCFKIRLSTDGSMKTKDM
jgi:hypothetical protein